MHFSSKRFYIAVSAIFLLIVFPLSGLAQTFRGAISGTVTDPSGAAVAGAVVKATQTETNLTHSTVTSSAGEFTFPDLPLGLWQVNVTQSGFEPVQVNQINVEVGKVVNVPVNLRLASQGQVVEVSAVAVSVDTDSSTLNAVIPDQAVQNIPLNGRDFTQLVRLAPGVNGSGSINGARSNQNNWQIDGADNNDLWQNSAAVNQGGVAGVAGTLLPIDAIDQFSVTSDGSAEYGRNGGATVNMVIKSGTNSPHGSLYYFNRNDALADKSPFAVTKAKLKNNQFGGSFGGPILKNKLFFFLTFERQKLIAGNSTAATEPSAAYVTAAEAVLTRYGVPVNPVSLNLLSFWPARGRTGPASANNFVSTDDSNDYSNNGIGKIDYTINSKNNLSFRYFVGTGSQIAPAGSAFYEYYQVVPSRMQNFSLVDNQILSSRAVNQVLLGVNIFLQTFNDEDTSFNPVAQGLNTGVTDPSLTGSPHITISGFDTIGPTAPLGRIDSTGHVTDTFSYTLGAHRFRIGGEFRYSHNDVFYNSNKRGTFTFDGTQGPWATDTSITDPNIRSLADFLAGDVSTSSIVFGSLQRIYDEHGFEWFAQDSWQPTRKLTLNYGIHYTAYGPFYSPADNISTFIPGQGVVYNSSNHNIYNWRLNDFAPRFGFAYSATSKLVVRGGYGIYFDVPNLNTFGSDSPSNGGAAGVQANPPVYTVSRSAYQIVYGQPIFTNSNIPAPPYNLFSVSQNLKTPSIQNFDLNTQYQLSRGVVLQVGYVGSLGRNLLVTRDINQAAASPLGTQNTLALAQLTRPFYSAYPQYAVINQVQSMGISDYNSMQVTVRSAQWHGLVSQFTYMLAHSLDDASAVRNTVPMDSNDLALDYGRSSFDIRHTFNGYIVYQFPRSTHGPSRLVNGWQLNALPSYRTGTPFNVTYGKNISGTFEMVDRVNESGNPFAGVNQGVQNRVATWFNKAVFSAPAPGTYGMLGRDVFPGPAFVAVDFSVVKNTPVTERISTQFRVEIFNVFNRTNYANPTSSFSSGAFGTIAGTLNGTSAPGIGQGEPRNVQLALKIIF
jgi:Carboxypeptidase regulatory-like domain